MLGRFRGAGLAAVVVALGCDTNTGPVPANISLARHLDSLRVQAESLHTNSADARAAVIWRIEVVPALGGHPVPVTVTTRSGAKAWQGVMWKSSDWRLAFPDDSIIEIIAYSDDNVTNAVFAELHFSGDGPSYSSTWLGALAADTFPASAVDHGLQSGATLATATEGRSCDPARGISYPFPNEYSGSACVAATFNGSLSIGFPVPSGPLADYQTVTIASQPFDGVWMK